jgi:GNAT superfamily N-acetyltransferase
MNEGHEEFVIRLADRDDLDQIMELLAEATAWLQTKGTDQWQGGQDRRPRVSRDVEHDLVWVVERRSQRDWPSRPAAVIASITIDERADPDFWTEADQVEKALYCHRMVVAREFSGRGLGIALLDWAAWRARRKQFAHVRLDAWSTNDALHLYYKNLHFDMVRKDHVPGRRSGALFERPAAVTLDTGPLLVRVGRRRRPGNREARPSLALLLLRFMILTWPLCRGLLAGRPAVGRGPYLRRIERLPPAGAAWTRPAATAVAPGAELGADLVPAVA